MSATQSNLSGARYGYDFVVATTQASINSTMKEYLSGATMPEVRMYYNMDKKGNPVLVDQATLMTQLNNTDPFKLKEWDGDDDDDVPDYLDVINSSKFMYAFRAKIGLAPGYDPSDLPDIISLNPDNKSVVFQLMCSEFQVVEANGDRAGLTSYINQSQPDGNAWMFKATVDLKSVTDSTNLPPAVQQQVNNLGDTAFSVQQLIFDLDNALLDTSASIEGIEPGSAVDTALKGVFMGAYFSALQAAGKPVLGYTIQQSQVDPSTLKLSDFELQANPFVDASGNEIQLAVDEEGLLTLNYLCAANGNTLPPAVPFNWNWVENDQEAGEFDGVIAINRNTIANYFKNELNVPVLSNSFLPYVHVYLSDLDTHINYEWNLTAGQQPTISAPATGKTVLSYSYSNSASDQAGLNGDEGQMTLSPSYTLQVDFTGNQIVITQHLLIYAKVKVELSSDSGNIIDKTIVDTYTLEIDDYGRLTANLDSQTTDNSQTPGVNGFLNFFSKVNDLTESVEQWVQGLTATSFTDIPLSVIQDFVFPGGKTFLFKDAVFSDNQDLVGHISYADPS
ncbi:hypothetical protein GS399_04920 [Pedobacter sp. HMF7647]|uniref:Uncharacterized protein n=1 Tax=Hufsiella arboris TaxID=2695275 RepID=A0A7K1Y6W7_9SPHI|nr:hypothetical protein [Hufsiella arboris]MXV50305.1 hypothetical protein [Hufsiella arboris]